MSGSRVERKSQGKRHFEETRVKRGWNGGREMRTLGRKRRKKKTNNNISICIPQSGLQEKKSVTIFLFKEWKEGGESWRGRRRTLNTLVDINLAFHC